MSSKRLLDDMDNNSETTGPPTKKRKLDGNEVKSLDDDDQDDDIDTNSAIKHELSTSGEPLILNVGGMKYSTSLVTLSSDTNSILYKMFNGKFSLKQSKDGSYFIDRNGKYFEYILDYMRNGKLNITRNTELINGLIMESEYYQLLSLNKELLLQKSDLSQSKILKESDIDFLRKHQRCKGVDIRNCSLIHQGHMFRFKQSVTNTDIEKVQGKRFMGSWRKVVVVGYN